jgi:alkanesulfonate monooxygenase SsuD/methylene tetrahydromethanopterin reductase-like flavin-dependent oxidoreductase (luciferase family)
VGRGHVGYDYEALGLPFEEGQARTLEALEVILQAWSGQPVTHHGQYHHFDGVEVWPPPEQRPHPPVWMACASGPPSFAWAAQQGYNLLVIPYITTVERLAGLTRAYREAWTEAGHDPAGYQIGSLYQVVVSEDGAAARRLAEAAMRRYMGLNLAAQQRATNPAHRGRPEQAALPIERLVDEGRLIAGTPDDCARQFEWLRGELGFTAVNCLFQFGGIDFATARRSMELFASAVMPRLRATPEVARA